MKSNSILQLLNRILRLGFVTMVVSLGVHAQAKVIGWEGDGSGTPADPRTFTLTAKHDFISTSDGNSHYAWGYSLGSEFPMQYPGPTLIVNQGDTVKVVLNNALPVPVSIVFPGQDGVTAAGGKKGLLTNEANPVPMSVGGISAGPTYTFVASRAGTYMYHSGTNPDLQIEMGLVGALIVRPANCASSIPAQSAFCNPGTQYDREHLFVLSEMDTDFHWQVYGKVFAELAVEMDTTTIHPSVWFINGRTAPDTMLESNVYWLPSQPYNALPRMHPGERLLMRVVSAGRDLHPFHHHGNHSFPLARDGQVLASTEGGAVDLTSPDFTIRAIPGQTLDLIYEWTGKGIGWDIYGTTNINPHNCTPDADGFDSSTREWCADHNKPIPLTIPGVLDIAYGESYSGSPFLGMTGALPEGHPGLNTTGGYYHMLHSHNEKEITTDNIFPGGMMTMLIVEPWSVNLDTE